jgi:hypothetical protein
MAAPAVREGRRPVRERAEKFGHVVEDRAALAIKVVVPAGRQTGKKVRKTQNFKFAPRF